MSETEALEFYVVCDEGGNTSLSVNGTRIAGPAIVGAGKVEARFEVSQEAWRLATGLAKRHSDWCVEARASGLEDGRGEICICGLDAAKNASELHEQISMALIDHRQAVSTLCDRAGRSIVEEALSQLPPGPLEVHDVHTVKRFHLSLWIARDHHYQAAKPILAKGGVYCVFHGRDLSTCPPESHGE